jgi:hypothetical protein
VTNQVIETRQKTIALLERLLELAPQELGRVGSFGYFFCGIHGFAMMPLDYPHPDDPACDAIILGGVLAKFADRQKGKGPLDSDNIDLRLREGDWYCEIFSCQDELSSAVSPLPGLAALLAYVEYLEGLEGLT